MNGKTFDEFVESTNDIFYMVDVDGNVSYISPQVERYGLKVDKIIAAGLQEYIYHEDQEKVAEDFFRTMMTGDEFPTIFRIEGTDGELYWLEDRGKVRRDENGVIIGVAGILRDITDQKEMEEKLQKQTYMLEERIKELNTLFMISELVQEEDISIKGLLQETVDIIPTGWQYPDKTCARIKFEGDHYVSDNFKQTKWETNYDITIHGKKLGRIEVFYLEEMPEEQIGPFMMEERKLLNSIAEQLSLIIERKITQKALKESEERFRDLFENANDLIQSVGPDGPFIFVNKSWKETMGYSDRDLKKMKVFDIIHPDHLEECMNLFQLVFQGEQVTNIETAFFAKDGRKVYVEGNVNCRMVNGEPVSTRAIFRDITDQVKAEEELREFIFKLEEANSKLIEADRMKDSFISITSHELRNPLAGIIGVLQLIKEGLYKDEEDLANLIDTMYTTSEDMIETLSDLLDLQKIEAGKMEMKYGGFDINELLDEMILIQGRDARENGLEFNVKRASKKEDVITSDRKRVKQVLSNLISNAKKFTEEGSIVLSVTKLKDHYLFKVKDTGIGIDPKDSDQLFQPFSQLSRKSKRKIKGTGLGLAICKSIVETLGGVIWIESEGLGKGTTAGFTIPLEANTEKNDEQ